jgi:hypothetical protein
MKLGIGSNRGVILIVAVVVLLGILNDFVGAVSGLYRWALTAQGQAMLLVGLVVVVLFLALDRFATRT